MNMACLWQYCHQLLLVRRKHAGSRIALLRIHGFCSHVALFVYRLSGSFDHYRYATDELLEKPGWKFKVCAI